MADQEQIVVFGLNKQQYALPVQSVSEIIRMMDITPVPNTDYYCKGIINLRGSVVPVISLNLRLGLDEGEVGDESRIIVVEKNDIKLGLIVDSVFSVTRYSPGEVESPESLSVESRFIEGIVHQENNMILLLDLNKVMEQR